MGKRGQFTLFVVIGLVALFLVGLIFYFRGDILSFTGISNELSYPSELQEVVDHVQECADSSSVDAVVGVGNYGGYYSLPGTSYTDEELGVAVPYYYYNGNDLMISKEYMENQLSQYVSFVFDSCVDLEQFSQYNLATTGYTVTSTINNNSVDIVIDYPITATIGESSYNLAVPYETSVDANLGFVYSVARQIVDAHVASPGEFSYTLLESFGLSSIVVTPLEDGSLIYVLTDRTSFNGEIPLTYMFAEHYALGEAVECVEDLDCNEGYSCTNGACKEVKE